MPDSPFDLLAVFLASSAADYMTGQIVIMDGGMSVSSTGAIACGRCYAACRDSRPKLSPLTFLGSKL